MSPSLRETHGPYNLAKGCTFATVPGPFNPNGPRSEAPRQPSTITQTENARDEAQNEDEDDDDDFGLPEGFEGLNIDDEDEFDRSWLGGEPLTHTHGGRSDPQDRETQ